MIEIENLEKSFGDLKAVDGASFRAEDGVITGLIGHNGAGKTTTFRVLAGLMKPDAGHARVDGFDCVTERIEAQRRLGVLPDVRGLYPRLTAREHIRYYGRLHGLEGETLEARIEELIQRLHMDEFADRRTRGFSRGQELKVALARALVHEPGNVILDEPTNGLDVPSARAVHDLIHEMKAAGRTIILSSHIMSEVSRLCDKLVIMVEGRVVMQGSPAELVVRTGHENMEDIFIAAMSGIERRETRSEGREGSAADRKTNRKAAQ
ncbi:MAG: ATP-binding cassette domain-containing protein [Proteobacteria bacterium]|nr:ATP-binding cassette domain-containing protein [Pseudomonadota bacterium]